MKYGKIVDGNEIKMWCGIAQIIYHNKCKEIVKTCLGLPNEEPLTLNDCLKIIGYDGAGVVTVIFEDYTKGEIYQYGNCIDENWYTHGETKGFV